MSKLIFLISSTLVLLAVTLSAPAKTEAFDIFGNTCGQSNFQNSDVCKEVSNSGKQGDPVKHIIAVVIDIISYIVGVLAIIFILVSSIRFLTSGGDSQSVAEAKSGLVYALVGIAVVVLAQAFVDFVLSKL